LPNSLFQVDKSRDVVHQADEPAAVVGSACRADRTGGGAGRQGRGIGIQCVEERQPRQRLARASLLLLALLLFSLPFMRPSLRLGGFDIGDSNAVRLALALAFHNGLAYQGLCGSFEDARHLWLLFGLLCASQRIEVAAAGATGVATGRTTPPDHPAWSG
jgi:hypothetical protein